MTTLTANNDLQAFLMPLTAPTEIRDPAGRLLGVYTPAAEPRPDYAEVRKLFDPEELRRRKDREGDHPGYTLDQVMQHLRSLEPKQ